MGWQKSASNLARQSTCRIFLARYTASPLIVPINLPQKISKEDIAVAIELARAADEASETVQKRQLRQRLMETCARKVESLCEERKQHHEGSPLESSTYSTPHFGVAEKCFADERERASRLLKTMIDETFDTAFSQSRGTPRRIHTQ